MKSPNMISTMGFSPASAMPHAMPVKAHSLMGAESTRSGNRVERSRETLNAPP